MIEINLVPEHLRKKWKPQAKAEEGIPLFKEKIIGLGGGFLVLLLVVHGILQFIISNKFSKYEKYKKEWEEISPARTNVNRTISELKQLREKMKSMEEVTGGQKISWSRKLNEISDSLSRGVWLNRIVFSEETLLMQGSAVSKNKTEMISVHKFTSNLKNHEGFKEYFSNVELELIKSRRINMTSIADFTIRGDLK